MPPPLLEPSCLRTQNVTSEPSGENPGVRSNGLASPATLPRVKLWNSPEPACVTHTSICPSRSDRNATKCPSRDTAAASSTPSKSVTVWNRASAMGFRQKYSVLRSEKPAAVANATTTAASSQTNHHLFGDFGIAVPCCGEKLGPESSVPFSCAGGRFRLSTHASSSPREA